MNDSWAVPDNPPPHTLDLWGHTRLDIRLQGCQRGGRQLLRLGASGLRHSGQRCNVRRAGR